MSVTPETSHEETSPSKAVAKENMPLMSVTPETSHRDRSPSKAAAPRNMPDMSVTRDRSGASGALCVMCEAPQNALRMPVQLALPHCSIDLSFCALVWQSPNIRESPDTLTAWLPAGGVRVRLGAGDVGAHGPVPPVNRVRAESRKGDGLAGQGSSPRR